MREVCGGRNLSQTICCGSNLEGSAGSALTFRLFVVLKLQICGSGGVSVELLIGLVLRQKFVTGKGLFAS